MRPHGWWLLLLCTACPAPPASTLETPPRVCIAGSVAQDGGCAPVLPTEDCGPGTFPHLGETTCQPVGVTSCDGGLRPRSDGGWGCEAVLPLGSCFDAGYALPGDSDCHPLGDCAAPFPPAGATYFVDAALDAGQLDGTHFATISDALAAAPANAVIAVEAGTYVEGLVFTKAQEVVGRCAAQVVVLSTGSTAPGLDVRARGVKVSGLTLTGHRGGAVLVGAAELTAQDCDFVDNRDIGLAIFDAPAKLTLERCAVRRTHPMANGTLGRGLEVETGATVTVRHSLVEENAEVAIFLTGARTSLELSDSLVWKTRASGDGTLGRAVYAKAGAHALVTRSVLAQNRDVAVYVATGTAEVSDSLLVDTAAPPALTFGRGVSVNDGGVVTVSNTTVSGMVDTGLEADAAQLVATDTVVVGTRSDAHGDYGNGVFAKDGATVSLSGCVLADGQSSGVVSASAGTRVSLDHCLVTHTAADGNGQYGFGVVASGGDVSLTQSAVTASLWAGLVTVGGTISALQSIISGVAPATDGTFGHGVATVGDGRIELTATLVRDSAGVGVLCAGGSGSVQSSWVRHNTIGVSAQDGTTLAVYEVLPAPFSATELAVTSDTAFEGNQALVGSGPVPVPPVAGAVPRR